MDENVSNHNRPMTGVSGPAYSEFESDKHFEPFLTCVDGTSESANRRQSLTFLQNIQIWWALVFHLALCIGLSATVIFALDDYMALDASTPRPLLPDFRFRASDITTLISTGLILVRIAVESWASITLWRCLFILLENSKSGLSLLQINSLMTWPRLPWTKPKEMTGYAVWLTLLCISPHPFLSPLLAGSVDWQAGLQFQGTKSAMFPPRSRISFYARLEAALGAKFNVDCTQLQPNEQCLPGVETLGLSPATRKEMLDWSSYLLLKKDGKTGYDQFIIRSATAIAGNLWRSTNTDSSFQWQRTCRLDMYHDGRELIPVGSIAQNAILPCIEIHSITWEDWPLQSDDDLDTAWKNYPSDGGAGSGILYNDQGWNGSTTKEYDLLQPLEYPKPVVVQEQTGVLLFSLTFSSSKNNTWEGDSECVDLQKQNFNIPIFGNVTREQVKSLRSAGNSFCLAYARIKLTAGLVQFPRGTFLDNNIIEAPFPPNTPIQWIKDRWAAEALLMMPYVMTSVAAMNQSTIPTWNNLDSYVENLIRISYTATWSSLRQFMEDAPPPLIVEIAHPRVQAKVDKRRVISWLAVSLLLQVSGIIWYFGAQRSCKRGVVVDGTVAALLTDASELLARSELSEKDRAALTNISFVDSMQEVTDKIGKVQLIRGAGGKFELASGLGYKFRSEEIERTRHVRRRINGTDGIYSGHGGPGGAV